MKPFLPPCCLFLLLAACGGGGGGASSASVCDPGAATAANGLWGASISNVQAAVGSYLPCGLDGNALELALLAADPIEGGDECVAVYQLAAAGLDLSSPANGGQPLALVGVAFDSWPSGTFTLGGYYYFPSGDLTVALNPFGVLGQPVGDGNAFAQDLEFELYQGQVLVALPFDEPGVDDDGDGEIDEPGEFALDDAIQPGAVLLAAGQLTLTLRR